MRVRLPTSWTTIRTRILLTMALVAGVALVTSGTIVGVLQGRHLNASTTAQLQRQAEGLRILAVEGTDPRTREPFTDASAVLRTYLERSVVAPGEGEMAFVESKPRWLAPTEVALRPEDDAELMSAVAPWVSGSQTVIETVTTSRCTYRVLVVPVIFDTGQGALVRVVDMDATAAELRRTMILYALAGLVCVVVVIAMARFLVVRLLRPVADLKRATQAIDESDLTSRVPVSGRDELSSLAIGFNRMLDRVEHAVLAQRNLLDDVGHELRTPLTVVRGHLELIDPTSPQDVRLTRDLALDELDRMGVLVNDILTLAKADQADFIRLELCQVATLTDQVFDKARALGERQWVLAGLTAVNALLDPARITQAWLQLAANAVKYSETGSRIALGSGVEDHEILLWVTDEGIGIPAEEMTLVRERFGRGREASQRAPGSGLGLAIVESIATAHGGSLDIASTVGEGSTVTLRLPLLSEPGPEIEEN